MFRNDVSRQTDDISKCEVYPMMYLVYIGVLNWLMLHYSSESLRHPNTTQISLQVLVYNYYNSYRGVGGVVVTRVGMIVVVVGASTNCNYF